MGIRKNIRFVWERGFDNAGGFHGDLQSLSPGDFRALANGESLGLDGD